ncbi:hypothetical protein F8388_013792 [Cannabis sativa]|uniref:PPPDE domain-containing protein n=1 Tax=Cannabis sativa TaxID=3483 RepID=A0A7J6E6K4_CANSA|nr:hypothetical protein F8388_013792 [Cannabis sativa]KAF4390345.1 hypothetical protein G4B88_024351 [Cannabis sativa]
MLCRMVLVQRKKNTGKVPVYLNVYDLTPINGYAYWLGLGVYHSGVQVHDVEYAFGAHDHATTGIFEVEPKVCPGFTFRKSILIGRTDLGPKDVRTLMEKLAEEYSGNTYHLITKNCNHFCNDVCIRLTGKPIPRWVNRLARLGLFCNCVLPAGLNETKVSQVRSDGVCDSQKKKMRSHSSRFPPSTRQSSLSSTSLSSTPATSGDGNGSASRSSRQKRCIPPSSSLIHSSSTSALSLKL